MLQKYYIDVFPPVVCETIILYYCKLLKYRV